MNKKTSFKLNKFYAVIALLLTQNAFAANFTIAPFGTLPTTVPTGQSVSANYTLTNMTNTTRNGYVLTGFPATVTQNTTSPNCTNPINLGPNASCNLQLDITGAVSSNFAICKGNSCTTATTPLNVSVSSAPRAPRFAYVTKDKEGATDLIEVCNVNPDSGPNPGVLTGCIPAITGSTTGGSALASQPIGAGITFNSAGTVAYITITIPTPNTNSVFQCNINQTDGTFTLCSEVDITSPSSPNPYYGYYGTPAINNNSTYAFFASYYSPEVFACPITNGNVSGTCSDTGVTGASYYAAGMTLNPANNRLYIANWQSSSGVTVCTGSGTTFSSCSNVLGDAGGTVTFDRPSGVAVNSTGTKLYVADYNVGIIYYCDTSLQSATFTHCSIATISINYPWTITINAAETVAYVADYDSTVYVCQINSIDGSLSSCNPITFSTPPVDVGLLY
jgi:DNA-binding beta-propeller fold protein YncE